MSNKKTIYKTKDEKISYWKKYKEFKNYGNATYCDYCGKKIRWSITLNENDSCYNCMMKTKVIYRKEINNDSICTNSKNN